MRGREPSKNRLATIGLVAALVAAVFAFFAYTKDNPFDDPFQVKAAFREVGQLRANSPVRIAGVNVGKVKEVEGGPASAPADGPTVDNHLHSNPYPNTASPGQPKECEAGNEPYARGQTVIGNTPGRQQATTEQVTP